MKTKHIESQFERLGARLKVAPPRRWQAGYAIDIQHDREGEFFELRVPNVRDEEWEATVMQADPARRHLLLLVRSRIGEAARRNPTEEVLDRFLCGHDERHWFVAAVPGGASSVAQAMEALKPAAVRQAQASASLNRAQANRRNNRAFRRQGEWFFVPEPALRVDPKLVLRNEPIRRGGGKAHIVEELHRTGGERVYVGPKHPNGLTEADYRNLVKQNPAASGLGWRVMVRNAAVYARGKIRHPDHAVITLPGWHRVLMNTENESRSMANVAFLD